MLTPPHTQPAVDLDACDREPIHHIGVVQPHGALLAAEIATHRVRCASLNLAGFTGLDARTALGRTLDEVLGADHCATLFARPLTPSHPELIKPWFATLRGDDGVERRVECYPHVHDDHLLLEFVREEPRPAAVWEQDLVRQRIIAEMIKPNTVAGLAEVGARLIREITGFDRVMIYRFAPDLHGEVIAESTSRADSFMGLHYPAADIPVFQLSLDTGASPAAHAEIARQLAFLRRQGTLIVASGNLVHNLARLRFDGSGPFDWAVEFDTWAADRLTSGDTMALCDYGRAGSAAALSVPTDEHYLPALYAAALREPADHITFFNEGFDYGSVSMRSFVIARPV